jgi:ADP-ribose pyrophosphatase YjhB (NUDIX family)/ketosteroid isomerase-like protein
MTDPMDLVRQFFEAVNRSDAAAVTALYHDDCIAEYVFTDDEQVHEGVARVREGWAAEFVRFAGAGAGARRVEVDRIAGMETGWGWARADWRSVLREAGGAERHVSGYSHFWVEGGLIRRHRSIRTDTGSRFRDDGTAKPTPGAGSPSSREYPTKPIVGVGAVVLTDDGQVVLVKRRYEPLAGQWSLPGGRLELGETLEAGTAREIREETGLVVDVGPVVEVFDRILVDEAGRVRYHFVLIDYLCRPRAGTLMAGSDVSDVALVEAGAIGPYRLTEKSQAVIQRAVGMWRPLSHSPIPPISH